jgi:hypothetical protein
MSQYRNVTVHSHSTANVYQAVHFSSKSNTKHFLKFKYTLTSIETVVFFLFVFFVVFFSLPNHEYDTFDEPQYREKGR